MIIIPMIIVMTNLMAIKEIIIMAAIEFISDLIYAIFAIIAIINCYLLYFTMQFSCGIHLNCVQALILFPFIYKFNL